MVGVPALLEELGVDLAAVIGPLGLAETLFSDAENMIAFPPGADPARRQEIEQRIVALANLSQTDLVGRLRCTLRTLLTTSRGSQEEVAELFSLHPRTLNRRLAEQGTSFKALVAEVRYDIACQLLANTALSVGQIAAILGYGEISALTRAFRRWSGMSPQAWRHQSRNAAVRPRSGEET